MIAAIHEFLYASLKVSPSRDSASRVGQDVGRIKQQSGPRTVTGASCHYHQPDPRVRKARSSLRAFSAILAGSRAARVG